MTGVDTPEDSQASMPTAQLVLVVAAATVVVVLVGFVFVLAPLHWPLGGIYVRLFVASLVVNVACLLLWNPVLIGRRMVPGKGQKTWDIVLMLLLVPVMIGVYVVAGLDGSDWVSGRPGAAWFLGLAIFVTGWILITWAMTVNPFFEKVVRIQTDHGHRVIEAGPYAYVRHPGYVGFSFWMLSTPLLLASTWAFAPAVLATAGFVIRTALEDRTLQRELPGYADYAARIRFRLIPGLW